MHYNGGTLGQPLSANNQQSSGSMVQTGFTPAPQSKKAPTSTGAKKTSTAGGAGKGGSLPPRYRGIKGA